PRRGAPRARAHEPAATLRHARRGRRGDRVPRLRRGARRDRPVLGRRRRAGDVGSERAQPAALPINPEGWPRPHGDSNGMRAPRELLAIAGQIGWDASQKLVHGGFVPQFEQALANVVAVVRAAGGEPDNLVSLTIFVTDRAAYHGSLGEVGEAYQRVVGKHFPAMALVIVAGLLEPHAMVEIQGLAVLPLGERRPE